MTGEVGPGRSRRWHPTPFRCRPTTYCHPVPRRCWNWRPRWRTRGTWSRPPNCAARCWPRRARVPEVCFQLAELLYRLGDVSAARERYYMAIELDEDYVEARANLGCVLAETGQLELAVAAFEGALRYHGDYPDVHYHLARTLDDLGRSRRSRTALAGVPGARPCSPWSDEARRRLGWSRPESGP